MITFWTKGFCAPPIRILSHAVPAILMLSALAFASPPDPEALAPARDERTRTPVFAETLEVDLRQYLSLGLADSPTLERQLSVINQRSYEVEEAYTQANPTAFFQSQYQRVEPPVTFNGGAVIQPADNYSFALTLQQPIYTFGRLKFSVLAAKLSRRSAQEEYIDQLQRVILGGADLYIDALVAEEATQIAVDELEAQNVNFRVTQALFEQGVSARFDVLRTGAARSQAEQTLIEANTARELSLDRLRSFMNINLEQPLQLFPLELSAPLPVVLPEAQEDLLERRSDLRALRWAVEAAKARVRLAKAENSPTLALQNQTVNRNATGLSPGTQNTTSIVLSIPLFDGGLSKARASQAEETVQQLMSELEQRERAVVLEAEETYRQLQDRWRSISVATENVEQADEALRVALLRYENGISTTVELLDTQAARSRARFELAKVKADYQRSHWEWQRVSAGDYPVEVPLPTEIRKRLDQERDFVED